jgi:hypothetical protein
VRVRHAPVQPGSRISDFGFRNGGASRRVIGYQTSEVRRRMSDFQDLSVSAFQCFSGKRRTSNIERPMLELWPAFRKNLRSRHSERFREQGGCLYSDGPKVCRGGCPEPQFLMSARETRASTPSASVEGRTCSALRAPCSGTFSFQEKIAEHEHIHFRPQKAVERFFRITDDRFVFVE